MTDSIEITASNEADADNKRAEDMLVSEAHWSDIQDALSGLLSVDRVDRFVDIEHCCPRQVWLEVNLSACDTQDRVHSIESVLDAVGILCVQSEYLRSDKKELDAFWLRVLSSKIFVQEPFVGASTKKTTHGYAESEEEEAHDEAHHDSIDEGGAEKNDDHAIVRGEIGLDDDGGDGDGCVQDDDIESDSGSSDEESAYEGAPHGADDYDASESDSESADGENINGGCGADSNAEDEDDDDDDDDYDSAPTEWLQEPRKPRPTRISTTSLSIMACT